MARTARSLLRSAATVTGAVAAVAGVGLVAGPAAGAAEPLDTTTQASDIESFDMYDVDADGWLDPNVGDASGNGVSDWNVVVTGGALMWLYDDDEDGWPDCYGVDVDGDNIDDLWGWDADQDLVVDDWTYDPAVHAGPATFEVTAELLVQSQPYG